VISVQRAGKVKGRASIALRFDRLSAHGEDYDMRTDRISRQARATKKQDAAKVGIGAGFGAAIGAIAGGGKGAAIGSAVGAGAGTGAVVATRGEEVRLEAGTVVTTKMREPLRVVVGR
jgi:outer membrane lipoprotein SlyB